MQYNHSTCLLLKCGKRDFSLSFPFIPHLLFKYSSAVGNHTTCTWKLQREMEYKQQMTDLISTEQEGWRPERK